MSFSQCYLATAVYVSWFFSVGYSVRLLGSLIRFAFSGRVLVSSTRLVYLSRAGRLFNPASGVASEGLTGYNSDACRGHDGPLV